MVTSSYNSPAKRDAPRLFGVRRSARRDLCERRSSLVKDNVNHPMVPSWAPDALYEYDSQVQTSQTNTNH
jgi:hypothetical protein